MTNTHTQNEKQESSGMNRRAFMRRGTAGAVALGGMAYARSPIQNVQAFPPAIVAGGLVATGYITREINEFIFDSEDDFDSEAYDEAEEEQTYNAMRTRTLQLHESDQTILTTIGNNISLSKNAAFSEGKKEAIRELNNGNGESAALDAATEANDEYFATPQLNLVKRFEQNHATATDLIQTDKNNIEGKQRNNDSDWKSGNWENRGSGSDEVTLVNGANYSYEYTRLWDGSYRVPELTDSLSNPVDWRIGGDYGNSPQPLIYASEWVPKWRDIEDAHAEVESDLETWVSSVGDGYESGDIDLSDVISPSDIANNAVDSDGFAYAGADLASMGLSTIGGNWDIRLEEADVVVRGTIYLLTNETLTTGQTYNPDNLEGPVYLAYEWEDGQFGDEPAGSDLIALEQDFTILGGTAGEWVENEDGERVYETRDVGDGEDLTFEETYQSTTDTDIEAFRDELQQLRERNEELEEQQRDADVVAGGSFADGAEGFLSSEIYGIPVIGWAIGLAGAGILFGGND